MVKEHIVLNSVLLKLCPIPSKKNVYENAHYFVYINLNCIFWLIDFLILLYKFYNIGWQHWDIHFWYVIGEIAKEKKQTVDIKCEVMKLKCIIHLGPTALAGWLIAESLRLFFFI